MTKQRERMRRKKQQKTQFRWLMAAGLAASLVGLGWDFYGHEIAGVSANLESFYAPPHLLIFGGIVLTALGFLLGDLALRKEGWYPLKMVTS